MMHERNFASLGLAAILALSAVPTAALAEGKIAVVRFEDMVRASPQYKVADTKMSTEFNKRKADLETQGKTLDDDIKKFQRDQAILSPDARAKTEKDLSARQVDLTQAGRKFQEDAQARQRDLTNEVVGKVRDAIVTVAKEKGYDLVVADPIYNATALDITDEVLKRLGATATAPAAK